MYGPLHGLMMLGLEAQKVVELRLVRIAWGGVEGQAEMASMVTEKISASIEAFGMLMTGGSPDAVVARYREHVAANTERLTAS
ncbi:hypothetical protein [Methylobacterium brachythecii]|uniref:Uncharacterized protein n=1 Tax=Methylobacterium brachythecii TaxID=1176177 RepID=A0A7W6AHI5_9HYPH|nr:hypothetical protein [Methylobacterium brachythecii]MBB3902441.1 hypothetical protein [Methylobacterium brachythecii]GLS42290.1 hypothetical protein GCM10007884_02750 [Methylobacterium brachythecii]